MRYFLNSTKAFAKFKVLGALIDKLIPGDEPVIVLVAVFVKTGLGRPRSRRVSQNTRTACHQGFSRTSLREAIL